MKSLLAASVLLATSFLTPANAITINASDIGLTGTTVVQGMVDIGNTHTVIPGLTGSLGLTFLGRTGTLWNFAYTVTNTSSGNVTGSSISNFGLDVTPNLAASGSTATGLFGGSVSTPGNEPVGIGNVDFCASTGPSCPGGASNGVDIGQSTSGLFSLNFTSVLGSITLDAADMRWQEITGTFNGQRLPESGAGTNGSVCPGCTITPVNAVPGPIAGAGIPGLLAACITLIGLAKRRRQRLAIG